MRHILIRLLINAVALFAAVKLIPGMHFTGGIGQLLLVAFVFGLVNAVVRPILTLLSCPLIVVTLGLFLLVINAVMLWLTSWLSTRFALGFQVDGFLPALLGGLVIGIVSTVLTLFVGRAADG
ncbi:MAG TPA: phage holin family protein [Gemmatimonadales bacterium]|jgi:putative membrane protein